MPVKRLLANARMLTPARVLGGSVENTVSEVLTWETEQDWDEAQTAEGVVHDEIADHAGQTTAADGYDIGSLTEGLIGYYPLDDSSTGSTAVDQTEVGNDGTINGASYPGSGQVGSDSLSFDGTDDYVELPDFGFGDPTKSFSVAFWFNPTDLSADLVPFGRYDGTDDILNFFYSQANDTLQFRCGHAGGNEVDATGGSLTTTGVWYHVAGVYDASGPEGRLYIDGAEVAASAPASVDDFQTTDGPWFGARNTSSLYLPGDMDDVRVYDRSLSPQEVSALSNRTATSPVVAGDTL